MKNKKPYCWSLRVMMLLFGSAQAMFSFRVLFMQSNGLTATQSGIVLCAASMIGTLSPVIGGFLADKLRSRYKVFLFTLFVSAVLIAFVPISAKIRLFGTILTVIIIPMITITMPSGMNMLENAAINLTHMYPGTDYSSIRLYMSLGFALTSLVYTPLINGFGVGAPFTFTTVFFVVLFLMRRTLTHFENSPEEDVTEAVEPVPASEMNVRRLFQNYYLMVFVLLNIIFCMPQNCCSFISYLLEAVGIDTAATGTVAGVRVIGEVLVMLALPFMKKRMTIPFIQLIATVMAIIEMIGYRLCHSLMPMLIVEMIGGASWGIAMSSAVLYLRAMAPRGLESTTLSLWYMTMSVSGIISMCLYGSLIDTFSVYSIYTFALICAVAWLVIYLGSYFIGRRVLHREPQICMTMKEQRAREARQA